jgi:hypothetical protein
MKEALRDPEMKALPELDGETLGHCVKLAFSAMRREMEASLRKS